MKIIIIGAGPGGYETALEAASRGIEVILVSEGPLGGTCLNEGCIPTKTFINCSSLEEAQQRKAEVVAQLRDGIGMLMKNKLITLVYGHGRLTGANTVDVDGTQYTADKVIIATGSTSADIPVPGKELAISSRELLELKELPKRLCIIGGGVIGLEFASIFASYGSVVTVIEYCPNILPRFDIDIAKRLKQLLSKKGITIETSAQVCGIKPGFNVEWTRKGEQFSTEADLVLMAVGRKPAIEGLGLEEVGIASTRRGITVDENMQTSVPGVYAIGDANGGIMLAHVATYEGRRALNHICGVGDGIRFDVVPSAVFTKPELATVGLTEEECKDRGIAFKALKSFYRANGKAVSMGETEGYCKILAEEGSGRILGCHILGAHSSDIIHEAAVLINLGATTMQAHDMIHAHPTLSEVFSGAL